MSHGWRLQHHYQRGGGAGAARGGAARGAGRRACRSAAHGGQPAAAGAGGEEWGAGEGCWAPGGRADSQNRNGAAKPWSGGPAFSVHGTVAWLAGSRRWACARSRRTAQKAPAEQGQSLPPARLLSVQPYHEEPGKTYLGEDFSKASARAGRLRMPTYHLAYAWLLHALLALAGRLSPQLAPMLGREGPLQEPAGSVHRWAERRGSKCSEHSVSPARKLA